MQRTLKTISLFLLGLALLANAGAYFVYQHSPSPAALIIIVIFNLVFVAPAILAFGLYVLLVDIGQKINHQDLTNNLFKDVPISQK